MRKIVLAGVLLVTGCTSAVGPGSEGVAWWDPSGNKGESDRVIAWSHWRRQGQMLWLSTGTRLQVDRLEPEDWIDVKILDGEHAGKSASISRQYFKSL